MRSWSDTDAKGNKLTDGRICLVITQDAKPGEQLLPDIRVYGRDKDEVLDKLALGVETGQAEIERLRTSSKRSLVAANTGEPSGTGSPALPARTTLTTEEAARATADLANPAKSPQAVKTLLRGVGVDLDRIQLKEEAKRVAMLSEQWENSHPEFPKDPRNKRLLVDKALLMSGWGNIDEAALDKAYAELLRQGMIFEVVPVSAPVVPPGGNPDSRTTPTRTATTYRSNALRTAGPGVAPRTESAKEQEWRRIAENGTSKELRTAIETEPGFNDWYSKKYVAKTA